MKRRDFLKSAGAFIVAARLLPACGDNGDKQVQPDGGVQQGVYVFPQGVASGDPRPNSVVLWTRAVAAADDMAVVPVRLEVASDADFATPVVDMQLTAALESDHTVRVLVTSLSANTTYYYRFTAGADQAVGRTRTSPAATDDVQVNLAWVSCQDYQSGQYGAYAQMLVDDMARAEADQIHFVMHVGDAIYETIDDPSQRALDASFEYLTLKNADGSDRIPLPFPSGGGTNKAGAKFARTVDDYRHLYKTYFADPNIQAARARWPFIYTWDDHEFSNDYWQSQANYIDGVSTDEPSQTRKYNANHAWFEYIPAHLSGAPGVADVTQNAKDFTPATVADAPFTTANADNFVDEPNNVAAVGSMTIYRSLRWGKHVELVMTDERSYRSDHAIPEDFVAQLNALAALVDKPPPFFDPRNFLPLPLVNVMDAGENLPLPTFDLGSGVTIDNPRVSSPAGTMLGKTQREWWQDTMSGSDATWKLWGNEVPLMRMFVNNYNQSLGFDRVLDGDAWDGYNIERRTLMGYLLTNQISNVVALTGDIHAHFGGIVMHDFDDDQPLPVMAELVTAGISSNSLFSFYEAATRGLDPALRGLVTVDASGNGGSAFTENINLLLKAGTQSAGYYAATKSVAAANSVAVDVNPHIKYVDTNAQGYGYAKVTDTQIEAQLVTINRPIGDATGAPGVLRTASFVIPSGNPAGMTTTVTGTKPFPLS